MADKTNIKIDRQTHLRLNLIAAEMALAQGGGVDLSKAIDTLIEEHRVLNPTAPVLPVKTGRVFDKIAPHVVE